MADQSGATAELSGALGALLRAGSPEALQTVLKDSPFLLELPALAQLAMMIAAAQSTGEADAARHLLAHLLLLLELYNQAHSEQVDGDEQAQFVELLAALTAAAESLHDELAAHLRRLSGWALNTLGNHCAAQGDHEAAVAAYGRGLEQTPDNAMLYRNRAGELIALQRYAAAAQDVEKAAQLEPDAPRLAELRQALEGQSDQKDSSSL